MSQRNVRPYALKFWHRPGAVLLSLFETKSGHELALFVGAFFGFVQALPVYLNTEGVVLPILIAGLLLGLVGIYFFSWLLRNFARWFGGQATLYEVRTALGLGLLPWTILFFFMMPLQNGMADEGAVNQLYWIFFVFFVYGYVILLLSLSAALRLSPIKTFLCMAVTFLVSLFPLSLVAQLLMQGLESL
mgnify:CR=1 FL=1